MRTRMTSLILGSILDLTITHTYTHACTRASQDLNTRHSSVSTRQSKQRSIFMLSKAEHSFLTHWSYKAPKTRRQCIWTSPGLSGTLLACFCQFSLLFSFPSVCLTQDLAAKPQEEVSSVSWGDRPPPPHLALFSWPTDSYDNFFDLVTCWSDQHRCVFSLRYHGAEGLVSDSLVGVPGESMLSVTNATGQRLGKHICWNRPGH